MGRELKRVPRFTDVTVPIAGSIILYDDIDAPDRAEAVRIACERASEVLSAAARGQRSALGEVVELESFEHIVQGNVCYVSPSEVRLRETEADPADGDEQA